MARLINSRPLYPSQEHSNFRKYSDGIQIGGGLNLKPAPYLPIVDVDPVLNAGIVIKKGTFVTLDANGYLVPAFVGEKTLTYTQTDVEHGVVDIDTGGSLTGPKTSTNKLGTTETADVKIGKPIGVALTDVFKDYNDPWFKPQKGVSLLQKAVILLGVDTAHDSVAYTAGDLLVLDASGFPVPLASQENVALDFVVGRLIKLIDVVADPSFTGGLENVEYVPEEFASGLPGKQTAGIMDGIDLTTKKGLLIQLWI